MAQWSWKMFLLLVHSRNFEMIHNLHHLSSQYFSVPSSNYFSSFLLAMLLTCNACCESKLVSIEAAKRPQWPKLYLLGRPLDNYNLVMIIEQLLCMRCMMYDIHTCSLVSTAKNEDCLTTLIGTICHDEMLREIFLFVFVFYHWDMPQMRGDCRYELIMYQPHLWLVVVTCRKLGRALPCLDCLTIKARSKSSQYSMAFWKV